MKTYCDVCSALQGECKDRKACQRERESREQADAQRGEIEEQERRLDDHEERLTKLEALDSHFRRLALEPLGPVETIPLTGVVTADDIRRLYGLPEGWPVTFENGRASWPVIWPRTVDVSVREVKGG